MRALLTPPKVSRRSWLSGGWCDRRNFNVLYEVHLFGVLPVLVAALILARSQARAARGVAFGVLLGATLLLRNELAITTAVVGVAIVVQELRERRSGSAGKPGIARAYGVPIAVVILLTAGAYWRSTVQGDLAPDSFRVKHTLNVCQAYAFNYQQRHPTTFEGNPFIHCEPLMRRTFGASQPSFREATAANPGRHGGLRRVERTVVAKRPAGIAVRSDRD